MSDASKVMQLVYDMAATTSRTEKERLLQLLVKEDLGKFAIKWAYDPFVTFGLTPARQESAAMKISLHPTLVEPLLQKLATRELSGNAAQREVAEVMQALEVDGAELLFRILSKDLKCGIGEATIEAAMPGLIPTFSVMRAHAYEAKRVKEWPVKGEPKLDGMRVLFICRGGNGGFFSRSGKRWPALDHMVEETIETAMRVSDATHSLALRELLIGDPAAKAFRKNLNFVLDGEVMTGLFATTGKVKGKKQVDGAEIHLFHIISWKDFDVVGEAGLTYDKQRKQLEEFVHQAKGSGSQTIQITPSYYLNNDDEVQEFYDKFINRTVASYLARGNVEREKELLPLTIDKETGKPKTLEGMIVKHTQGRYQKKKGYVWMKLKGEETEDLPITGFFNGEPTSKNAEIMGGVIVNRNGVEVRVGGGWSDDEREALWELWKHDAAILGIDPKVGFKPGYSMSLSDLENHESDTGFKLLYRLLEVKFHEVTPDGSLRHPNAVRFRDDKAGELESKEAA